MESNSIEVITIITAFIASIPSNPQVFILSSHHHSMLLPSNHSSEAKARMFNHYFSVSLIVMNHWTLSLYILSTESIHSSHQQLEFTNYQKCMFTPITQQSPSSIPSTHTHSIHSSYHHSIEHQWPQTILHHTNSFYSTISLGHQYVNSISIPCNKQ